jgi:hypothetical protein
MPKSNIKTIPPHLFFAYGSNMNQEQIKARCQKPEVLTIARLSDHAMAFFDCSKIWDGGQETLVGRVGEDLWGVVYKLSFSDGERLDAWQDVRLNGTGPYFHYPTEVTAPDGSVYPVFLYKKDILGEPQMPSEEYLAHILSGAVSLGLPEAYIEKIKKTLVKKAGFPVPRKTNFDRSILANLSCDCGG